MKPPDDCSCEFCWGIQVTFNITSKPYLLYQCRRSLCSSQSMPSCNDASEAEHQAHKHCVKQTSKGIWWSRSTRKTIILPLQDNFKGNMEWMALNSREYDALPSLASLNTFILSTSCKFNELQRLPCGCVFFTNIVSMSLEEEIKNRIKKYTHT